MKHADNDKVAYRSQPHISRNGYTPVWYVSDLPGHNGTVRVKGDPSDWGWTDERVKAISMSVYWQRRFMSDCRKVCSAKAMFGLLEPHQDEAGCGTRMLAQEKLNNGLRWPDGLQNY